ncbi:MAG: AarF/UbiB family protein [Rikenellaceae bacterium]
MIQFVLSFLRIKRGIQIVVILINYGFTEIIGRYKLIFKKKNKPAKHQVYTTPRRIRQTIEQLGPTYVKFGQILADRPDVVSEKFRKELKQLQSNAKPFDTSVAINIIENSQGDSIENLFEWFDKEPFAAASIGQVYRAKLKTGEQVVVKVQRPIIENKIKMDIYLMKFLAKKLAKNYPELMAINVVGLVDEFAQNILKELDYNTETSNVNIFRMMFKNSETVKIPKVFEEFTTRTLIVLEYIDGETPDNKTKLLDAGLSPAEVVKNGTNAIFKMIFEHGIFHADPHPGNIFILKGNIVSFIDFGMIGILRPREMNFLADFIIGYSKRDSAKISKALLELCKLKYFEKSDELTFAIHQTLMNNFGNNKMELKNFSTLMQDSINILIKFNLQIPSGIFLLMKAMASVEKFAENLAPDLDLAPIITPYAETLLKNKFSSKKVIDDIKDTLNDYFDLIKTLPSNINEILIKLKEGKIRHDISLDDNTLFVRTANNISRTVAYTILLIGLFIGATILIVWDSEQRFGYFVLYLSFTLILMLLFKWFFMKKN